MSADVVSTSPHEAIKEALVVLFEVGLSATGLAADGARLPAGLWAQEPLPDAEVGLDEHFGEFPSHCFIVESDGVPAETHPGIGMYDVPLVLTLITPQDMDPEDRAQRTANIDAILAQRLHDDEPEPWHESILAFRLNRILEAADVPAVVWDFTPDTKIAASGGTDMEGRDQREWKFSLRASTKTVIADITPP